MLVFCTIILSLGLVNQILCQSDEVSEHIYNWDTNKVWSLLIGRVELGITKLQIQVLHTSNYFTYLTPWFLRGSFISYKAPSFINCALRDNIFCCSLIEI